MGKKAKTLIKDKDKTPKQEKLTKYFLREDKPDLQDPLVPPKKEQSKIALRKRKRKKIIKKEELEKEKRSESWKSITDFFGARGKQEAMKLAPVAKMLNTQSLNLSNANSKLSLFKDKKEISEGPLEVQPICDLSQNVRLEDIIDVVEIKKYKRKSKKQIDDLANLISQDASLLGKRDQISTGNPDDRDFPVKSNALYLLDSPKKKPRKFKKAEVRIKKVKQSSLAGKKPKTREKSKSKSKSSSREVKRHKEISETYVAKFRDKSRSRDKSKSRSRDTEHFKASLPDKKKRSEVSNKNSKRRLANDQEKPKNTKAKGKGKGKTRERKRIRERSKKSRQDQLKENQPKKGTLTKQDFANLEIINIKSNEKPKPKGGGTETKTHTRSVNKKKSTPSNEKKNPIPQSKKLQPQTKSRISAKTPTSNKVKPTPDKPAIIEIIVSRPSECSKQTANIKTSKKKKKTEKTKKGGTSKPPQVKLPNGKSLLIKIFNLIEEYHQECPGDCLKLEDLEKLLLEKGMEKILPSLGGHLQTLSDRNKIFLTENQQEIYLI